MLALRQQHLFYGLTKAARVFFTRQESLRQVLIHLVAKSPKSLFEDVLHAATMPSPLKAIFGREEIEVNTWRAYRNMRFIRFLRLLL